MGKWIEAKHRNANTVPKIAPLLLGEPMMSSDLGVSLVARDDRKSDLARVFRIRIRSASDETVFGLMKKGWNSLCSSF